MKEKIFLMVLGFVLCMPGYLFAIGDMRAMKELESAETVSPEEVIERPAVHYTSQSLRDPFDSGIQKEGVSSEGQKVNETVELPALTVQGVIWGTKKPQVIINNKVLREGDMLDDVQVLEIKGTGITVLYKNRTHTIATPANAGTDSDAKGGSL